MTIYIVDLEPLENRYTKEWFTHVPQLMKQHFGSNEVQVISGPSNIPTAAAAGQFLNFSSTNVYKSVQTEKISHLFCQGQVTDGDYFLFTDAWHPGIINLRYMIDLQDLDIKIGALWHAGAYDWYDILGQKLRYELWVDHVEKSYFHAIDNNFFATDFHINMFCEHRLHTSPASVAGAFGKDKIVKTGWPMEYMKETLAQYQDVPKENLIVFPHRISSEKQVEMFRDLARCLPEYQFIVCQDQQLTKQQYHKILAQAKIVFSASNQETLGLSQCCEGPLSRAIPLSPKRVSYKEIFKEYPELLYPSEWTSSWDMYFQYREELAGRIIKIMKNYDDYCQVVDKYIACTYQEFFNSTIHETIKQAINNGSNDC